MHMLHTMYIFSPQLCVGSCFWFCIPLLLLLLPLRRLHHFVTHTTFSHAIFHTTMSHTHNFATHHYVTHNFVPHFFVTHTQLGHTQLCHTPSFTDNFVTHTQLCHMQLCNTLPLCCLQPSSTHDFVTNNFVTHTHPHTHPPSFTHNLRGRRGTWRHPPSFCVAGVALVALGWVWCCAWSPLVARDAAALCVAGVALADIDVRFACHACPGAADQGFNLEDLDGPSGNASTTKI